MTTVQIVGIAVAAAIIVVLVIAVLVTRQRDAREDETAKASPSFLDQEPQDTFDRLGKAEQRPAPPDSVFASAASRNDDDLGLDWGPSGDATMVIPPPEPHLEEEPDDSEVTGELPAAEPAAEPVPAAPVSAEPVSAEPVSAEPVSAEPVSAEPVSAPPGRRVPLSDIIVTTSTKVIDLDDPEVRQMLTDLVTFEIDQATQYRQQGQDIDAVLQLTEAEKVARALGMDETAGRIRAMMSGLQG